MSSTQVAIPRSAFTKSDGPLKACLRCRGGARNRVGGGIMMGFEDTTAKKGVVNGNTGTEGFGGT